LGVALLAQGKTEPAIQALERAVATAPAFAHARTDLARAYREGGRLDAARQELQRVLKEAPALDAAWLAYADVLVELKKFADAKFAFEQARLLDPHLKRIEKATAAFVAGDRQTAETIFRDILKSDASHVAALCGLAALALGGGNTHDSERLLRHALKQTSHLPLARRGLGHTLLAAGRLPEAEVAIRDLL
jgi:Tfp pilus assembly protein PilF